MDLLGIVTAEVANIAERRVYRLTDPALSDGLPSMLVAKPGLNCGYMMPQYTAAALVSDNKTLAHPDSVDSIPTSAGQEDHVSMGTNAARHAMEIIRNSEMVVAIEMLSAAQALDLRPPELRRGPGTAVAYRFMRKIVPTMQADQPLSREMQRAAELVHSGEIPAAIARQAGEAVERFFR